MTMASSEPIRGGSTSWLALRYALRELRGGLRGCGVEQNRGNRGHHGLEFHRTLRF